MVKLLNKNEDKISLTLDMTGNDKATKHVESRFLEGCRKLCEMSLTFFIGKFGATPVAVFYPV
ncbi:MAG: hypothetical protein ABJI60_05830 [Kangiellaceae bacterium]